MIHDLNQFFKLILDTNTWISIAKYFYILGPIAPIGLAFIESIIPALPLIVIVTWNVYSFGPILGFLYSWMGSVLGSFVVFSFFRLLSNSFLKNRLNQRKSIIQFEEKVLYQKSYILFFISTLPFTPSFLVNMVYGFSKYSKTSFIIMVAAGKFIMIASLAIFGHLFQAGVTRNPINLFLAIIFYCVLYLISRKVLKKY